MSTQAVHLTPFAPGTSGLGASITYVLGSVSLSAAVSIQPDVRPWLLFSHRSREHGHARLLMALNAEPLVDLGLRLGEASGAAAVVPLLRLACALHNGMATFEQAGVSTA